MNNINLDKLNIEPIISHTSKGDQPKWKIDGYWYKQDDLGYESLSEVVISKILSYSNIQNFLDYEPVIITNNKKENHGCRSKNFLSKDEELFSIEKLHLAYNGIGLSEQLKKIKDTKDKIKYTVDFIIDKTNINDAGKILTSYLESDAFFLNEDRHTNNIAFIRNTKKEWRFAPLFDNGLSLLSDLSSYPLSESISLLRKAVKSKPFDSNFQVQLKSAESLYGPILKFSSYNLEELISPLSNIYPEEYITRIINILNVQKNIYPQFF